MLRALTPLTRKIASRMSSERVADPEAIVTEAYAALARGDGAALADLVDPLVLEQFRNYWIGGVLSWAELTDDGKHWPDGSGGSAHGDDLSDENIRAHAGMPVERVDGISNLSELAALSPRELLVHVVAAWGRTVEEHDVPSILGVVYEGTELAHVVYRRAPGNSRRLSLISLRMRDGRWHLLEPLAPGPAWGTPEASPRH